MKIKKLQAFKFYKSKLPKFHVKLNGRLKTKILWR